MEQSLYIDVCCTSPLFLEWLGYILLALLIVAFIIFGYSSVILSSSNLPEEEGIVGTEDGNDK